uniref:Uncharacterized protein n=1 Tax=Anopheles braziliensis TaxID=58242 RepID=A0A2M3ZLQ7_9DIPT
MLLLLLLMVMLGVMVIVGVSDRRSILIPFRCGWHGGGRDSPRLQLLLLLLLLLMVTILCLVRWRCCSHWLMVLLLMLRLVVMRLMSVGIVRGGHAMRRLRLCDAHHAKTTATADRSRADPIRDVDLDLRVGIERTGFLLRLGQGRSFGGRWKRGP